MCAPPPVFRRGVCRALGARPEGGAVGAGAALRPLDVGGPEHSPPRGAPFRMGPEVDDLALLPGLFPHLGEHLGGGGGGPKGGFVRDNEGEFFGGGP